MPTAVNENENNDSQDRILQVFEYLQALNEHRNPATRQIQQQPWTLWCDDLPEHPSITKVLRRQPATDDAEDTAQPVEGDNAILTVRRPQLTKSPPPQDIIKDWLRSGWEQPEQADVQWIESLNVIDDNGETVVSHFADDPERLTARDEWQKLRDQWRVNELPARQAMKIFERLYELRGRLEREGESVELVIGDGILSWQHTDGGFFHPLLIGRVQLLFDSKLPEFRIVDADSPMELYSSMFQSITEVNPQTLGRLRTELADSVEHPLDESAGAYLQGFWPVLSSRGVFVDNQRPRMGCEHPNIGRAPVLFLRTRNTGLASAIEQTIRSVRKRTGFCKALNHIVGATNVRPWPVGSQGDSSSSLPSTVARQPDVLFGKQSNREQLKIARRLDEYGAVLVQGPPGTGKSHTIANLIGHLLAQGKSVLVTSATTKALKVLRGHIVEEIRPLCVSVLDNDVQSRRDLEESVTEITSRLSEGSADFLEDSTVQLTAYRAQLVSHRETLADKLLLARTDEYREIVCSGESVSPSDAARELAAGEGEYDWIPGPIAADQPLPLSPQEVSELYATNVLSNELDDQWVDQPLPSLSSVLEPNDFAHAIRVINDVPTQQLFRSHRALWSGQSFTNAHLKRLGPLTEQFELATTHFKELKTWQIAAMAAGYDGGPEQKAWQLLIDGIVHVSRLETETRLHSLQHSPEFQTEMPPSEQLVAAGSIVEHLRAGRKLGLLTRMLNRQWKPAMASWKVRSGTPTNLEHFEAIQSRLRLHVAREQLSVLWDGLMARHDAQPWGELGDAPEQVCSQYSAAIQEAIGIWAGKWKAQLSELCELGFDWDRFLAAQPANAGTFGNLRRIVASVEDQLIPLLTSTSAALDGGRLSKRIRGMIDALSEFERPEVQQLVLAAQQQDSAAYGECFETMAESLSRYKHAQDRARLLTKLKRVPGGVTPLAASWAQAIESRSGIHGEEHPPNDAVRAWRWRQLDAELTRRSQTSIEQLQQQIDTNADALADATNKLIESLAWAKQLRHAAEYKQDLVGWLDTVRRIGAGYGKRVAGLRKSARQKMRNCRKAVPVWIMPLARIVENLDFTETQFDVVIIDEASQCDVMGLLAVSLGHEVVVVGDHEQVSPSAIGQDVNTIENLIRTHLDGIPNGDLYDGRMSIYDLARQSFGGLICLQEHFRCTTDIIQFSNYLSYNGTIKPLRDDPVFQDQVIEYRVEGAKRAGKINRTEAEAVASLIVAATELNAYEGLTFGVISLVGDHQALKIEELLRKRMSTEAFDNRKIVCGNSAQFQGDERDVMFLSMIDSPSDGPLRMMQAPSFQQRYNVAASRARNQMWVVHSLNPDVDLKAGDLRKRLIDHARDPKAVTREIETAISRSESPFETAVIERLVAERFCITPQWKVGHYRIDIVVHDGTNKLAVECDGDRYHGAEQLADDMHRQAILERLGWRFHRIRGSEFFRDPDGAMKRLFDRLQSMGIEPTAHIDSAADEKFRDGLTADVIRRAAEIREEWREEDSVDDMSAVEETVVIPEVTLELDLALNDSEVSPRPVAAQQSEFEFDPTDAIQQPRVDFVSKDDGSVVVVGTGEDAGSDVSYESRVIELLQNEPQLKAREIANRLDFDRQEVNSLLYGRLANHVSMDEEYRWSVKPNS